MSKKLLFTILLCAFTTCVFAGNRHNRVKCPIKGYKLVWNDEFNGSELDTSKWTYATGGGGWGNREIQNYISSAWGGGWGGAKGIDETCLPAVYEIDYVRIFQK